MVIYSVDNTNISIGFFVGQYSIIGGCGEMVNTQDLGSCVARFGGSSPLIRTGKNIMETEKLFEEVKLDLNEEVINLVIRQIANKKKVKGFRPGKVPALLIFKSYQDWILKQAAHGQALNHLHLSDNRYQSFVVDMVQPVDNKWQASCKFFLNNLGKDKEPNDSTASTQ